MKLALFDLDHTLIPFDSGMAWIRFLVGRGRLPADAEHRHLRDCQAYVAGTLDIRAMHRRNVGSIARVPRTELAAWLADFEREIAPRIPAAMQALVQGHADAGHRCAIVTATTRFLAEPFARLFGDMALIATEPQTEDGRPEGVFTGEIDGEPCHGEHKVGAVARWLAQQTAGPTTLAGFDETWFYSDSVNDLPLLGAVAHPVAVRPEPRLRAHALAAGWTVVDEGGA